MPTTSVEAILNLKGENDELHNKSQYTANNKNFANINNLKNIYVSFPKLMTLEHNINVLDGTIQHIKRDTQYNISYCGNEISNTACNLSRSKINIVLKEVINKDIEGLTFYFGDNISSGKITVEFRSSNGKNILTEIFEPKGSIYRLQISTQSLKFKTIVITFNKTRFPQVYPKLQSLEFGINYYFSNDNIISCTIDEEIYPISNMLPINICDITLYSKENEFNPFVRDSMFYSLSPNSSINIYGIYNGNRFMMGKFYLDTWDSTKDYELTLHCISILGKLDKIKFYGGGLIGYNDPPSKENSVEILEYIFKTLGYKENQHYTIDSATKTPLSGELPVKTYKEAIQLIAFTAGCYVDDTRDGIIKIGKQTHTNDLLIDKSITFEPIKITENEDITKINVDVNNIDYESITEFSTVFKGNLLANETKVIIANNPIIEAQYKKNTDSNWVSIPLYEKGKYTISIKADTLGGEYEIQTKYFNSEKYTVSENMKSDKQVKDNEISITSNTLLYSNSKSGEAGNITGFIERIKNYYLYNKYKVEFEFINNGSFKTGRNVSIYTQYNQLMIGTILKQHINLSGGFISTVTMLANNKDLNYDYYATTGNSGTITDNYELICGDNILI